LEDFFKVQYWYLLTHRLKKNEKICLKGNWYSKVIDATDSIPQHLKKICETVSKIFNLKFTGIDVIYDDKSKKKEYRILEINCQPWIRTHHLPMEWKPRNVAWAILDLYFKK
jgi:D-alanine-D-alanine ligase-like ATP-grasp enzyme